jgi:Tn3 transposase DDE domain
MGRDYELGFGFGSRDGDRALQPRIPSRPLPNYEEQLNQASCLNLVTNAVVLWNTVMNAVLDQQKAESL